MFVVIRYTRDAESTKGFSGYVFSSCYNIRVTSEPFEGTDGVVAAGAKVRHIPQTVHAERDQTTAVHTAAIKDTKEHQNLIA